MTVKIVKDMCETEYHSDPRMSSSLIKILALQTPAHYQHRLKLGFDAKETPALTFGKALHSAVLQPWDFDNKYCVIPDGLDRRSKEGKELWADILKSGKTPLKNDEFEMCLKAMGSVKESDFWQKVLKSKPQYELSLFSENNRIRTDVLIKPCKTFQNGLIVDLKTAVDGSPRAFGAASYKFGYDIQAAFYVDFVKNHLGFVPEFYCAVIEKSEPFLFTVYEFDELALHVGQKRLDAAYAKLSECQKSGVWPGYSENVVLIELPSWAVDDHCDDNLIFEGD